MKKRNRKINEMKDGGRFMKTLYVPKGETFEYERLYVPNVIVDGVLIVHHYMYISKIMRKGFIKI